MLRRLVAIYMTLVLTAGPGLCCCTPASVAVTPPRPSDQKSPAHSCCCPDRCSAATGAASAPDDARGDPGDRQNDHKPGKHQCPCRDKGRSKIDQSSTGGSTAEQQARLWTHVHQFLTSEPVPPYDGSPVHDSGGGRSPPGHRLTAERLLDQHHRLRC